MQLSTLRDRFDERLDTAAYADIDASANGLQVGPEKAAIDRVAFAVDAAAATIEAAAEADADLLVTHHGISWGGFDRITGREYDLIESLLDEDLALYVSHLPLDGHQELGNAAQLGDLLGLDDRAPFGEIGPEYVGQRGTIADPYTTAELRDRLGAELDTGGESVQVLDFGPDRLQELAILTGSGTGWIDEAAEAGVDALLTGEGKQKAYHAAREAGLTVVLAGHYATETGGVRALQALAEDWGLETTWIDHPTGL